MLPTRHYTTNAAAPRQKTSSLSLMIQSNATLPNDSSRERKKTTTKPEKHINKTATATAITIGKKKRSIASAKNEPRVTVRDAKFVSREE